MTNSRSLSPKESPLARAALNAWPFPAILALAAFIRFYRLGSKQLWLDEILQALHSSPRLLKDVLRAATEDRGATPLDYVVQHVVTNLLGQSEFSLRFHAALFGTLTIAVLYHFARTAFDRRIALVSSLLYAVYPLHHHYSQEGRPYALFTFLTVCSYLAFWRLLVTDRAGYWLYYSLVTAFLLYASYYGAFVVFSQVAFSCSLLLPRMQASLPGIRRICFGFLGKFLAAAAAPIALLIPWILFGSRTIQGYAPAPEQFGVKLFFRFIRELGDRSYPISAALLLFAICGALKLRSQQKYGHLLLLLSWFLLPVPLILLLLWLKDYFFAIRQILFATPALFILICLGISHISEVYGRRSVARRLKLTSSLVACVVLISAVVIFVHTRDRNDDLKGAGQFLQRNVSDGDVVVAPQIEGVLAYYFPDISMHSQFIDALPKPGAVLSTAGKVFIVKSRYMSQTDRRLADQAWEAGGTVSHRQLSFRGVEIIEFTAQEPSRHPVTPAAK